MNADSSLEASTWEKFTDGLTAMVDDAGKNAPPGIQG